MRGCSRKANARQMEMIRLEWIELDWCLQQHPSIDRSILMAHQPVLLAFIPSFLPSFLPSPLVDELNFRDKMAAKLRTR